MSGNSEIDAFACFVRDSGAALRRTAYLFTRDWYRADDLVQTALVRTFERRGRIRDPRAWESYTRKVMATSFLSERRLKSASDITVADLPEATGDDASAAVADTLVMWAALGELSNMQRAVLVLRYYGDATEAEIADTLGCSAGSVKTHAVRGLASLRKALADPEPTGPGANRHLHDEPRTAS